MSQVKSRLILGVIILFFLHPFVYSQSNPTLRFRVKVDTYTPADESVCVYIQNLDGTPQSVFKLQKNDNGIYAANITSEYLPAGATINYKYCRNYMPSGADESFDDKNATGYRTLNITGSLHYIHDTVHKWRWIPLDHHTATIDTSAYTYEAPSNLDDTSFQCGIWLPDYWWNFDWAWGTFYDHTLDHIIVNSHAGWVEIAPSSRITQYYPTPVIDNQEINATPDSILIKIITDAHKKGLRVFLAPFVYPFSTSDTCTTYHAVSWWQAYRDAWKPIILRYAQIAHDYNADLFQFVMWTNHNIWAIKNEEKPTVDSLGEKLLDEVKNIYPGKIVIQYNEFGPQLDLYKSADYLAVMIANYWPWMLGSDDSPVVDSMRSVLSDALDNQIYPEVSALGKKVILYSIAACSYNGTTVNSPDWQSQLYYNDDDPNIAVDFQEQADDYEAMLHEISTRSWIVGAYSFNYNYWSSLDKSPSIRSKPAEKIVKKWYQWLKPDNKVIQILSADHGTSTPEPSAYIKTKGSNFEITAIADSGYEFDSWNDTVNHTSFTDNPLSVTLDQDLILQPVFKSLSTGINEIGENAKGFQLFQNYPNPIIKSTAIKYHVPVSGHYQLDVFDIQGNELCKLVDKEQSAGDHTVSFDAEGLSSGTYVYKLFGNNISLEKEMIVSK